MPLINDWYMPHQVTLQAYAGASPIGDTYADPSTVRALVVDGNELVRDKDGQEVVSSTTVSLDPENWVPAGSLVTVWAGTPKERVAKVITTLNLAKSKLAHVELRLE